MKFFGHKIVTNLTSNEQSLMHIEATAVFCRHLVVLFGKIQIMCCKLQRFGHQMAGQMQQLQNSC